jgi:acyl-[acyl-carrier-protein]-phospholipid O-acyltransferase/long-chain-fatty-acid--[acyl-carrier-protein] ligase
MSEVKQASSGYPALLADGGFQSFLWTQFLGAFNDNVYKMIVSVAAVEIAASEQVGARYLSLAGAVFVIPFLLFAGYAGQLADRFSKTRVLQVTKAFEILIMITGLVALVEHSMGLLLTVLFLLAVQANFFSPAKYGILPETLGESQLTRANGLVELSTFAAIVLGTSAGAFLFARWKAEPSRMGLVLLAIAVVGSLTSLRIPRVPASGSHEPFHWNPFAEIWVGSKRLLQKRDLWLTVAGISYFWFLGALFQMTVILFGNESLHASDDRVGLLVTALAIGIGAGSMAAGWFSSTRIELGLVPWGAVLLGGCSLLVGSLHSVPWIAVALIGVGFGGGLFIVPLNAYLQDRADAQEKGRVLATNNFFNMLGVVLASGILSLLHDRFHWQPAHILEALGILTLASTFYMVWLMPAETIRFALWCTTHLMFRVRVIGAHNIPRKGGAVIASNHVSYADAVLIGCSSPRFIRFLMWQPYFENPLLKPLCSLLRAMPIPTGSPKEVVRALHRAQAEVEAGRLICIFPEGNLTRTGHVMAFERGVERIASGAGAPIIPIYLDGLWGHRLSRKPGASWWPLRRSVTVYVGEPITHKITADELRQRVLELGSVAVEYRKTGAATLSGGFIRAARRNWSALALADSTGRKFTFGRALTAALLFKRWVNSHCADHSSVGLLFPASVGGALANLGVTLAGKTAMNLNFTAGDENMRHSLERCGIRTVISSRAFLEKAGLAAPPGTVFVEDLLGSFSQRDKLSALLAARLAPARSLEGAVKPTDIAAVIFSSGSTGTPKGVMLSHWNLYANAEAAAEVYSVDGRDRMLGVLPFFHSFGYTYTLWFPMLHGFAAVFHPNPTDAKTIGELAGQYHPTLFLSTPTFCLNYVRKCTREQFSSLRYLLVGAEKLRPALVEMFEEKFGVTPLEGYGCTEMGPVVSVNTPDKEHGGYCAGSVGRPLPGVSLRIVDPDTLASLPSGQTGLLLAKGPSRMVGYLGDAERTEAALCDGYYITGDLAYLDKDGFLHIADRLARFSKIAGEMVPHLKIEEALGEVLGAGRCIVVGVPDERRGERLAVLYTGDDVTPAQMVDHLTQAGLPPLWIPKRDQFYLVEAIPVLGTGKVDLMKSRALAAERVGAVVADP